MIGLSWMATNGSLSLVVLPAVAAYWQVVRRSEAVKPCRA